MCLMPSLVMAWTCCFETGGFFFSTDSSYHGATQPRGGRGTTTAVSGGGGFPAAARLSHDAEAAKVNCCSTGRYGGRYFR